MGALESAGFDKSQRFFLFVLVCIPLRLSFSFFAHRFRGSSIVKAILLLVSVLAVITNAKSISGVSGSGNPWWSRKVHLVSSVLLAGTLMVLLSNSGSNDSNLSRIPSLILLADVLFGVGSMVALRPFV